MKTLVAILASAAILFSAGAQVFAADEGRVTDLPADLQPYVEAR